MNQIACLQKDGSWNYQRKLRNSRMYHLMAPHPCPKLTDQILICGGYEKSWKHQTDCEIIDEDGHDKNMYKKGMSLHPFVDKSSYWDATKSFYRGKPSYLTLTDQEDFNRATIITGGDPASGLDDFADVWLIVTNPKDIVGDYIIPPPGHIFIRQVGAYKIGNVNEFKKEIGKWERPTSSKVIRKENYRYDQFIEYNGKIFFHSPGTRNVVEFRLGSCIIPMETYDTYGMTMLKHCCVIKTVAQPLQSLFECQKSQIKSDCLTLYSTLIPTVTHRHHFVFNSRIFATDSIRRNGLYEIKSLSSVTHATKTNLNTQSVNFIRTYEESEHLMVTKCGNYPFGYWSDWAHDVEWCEEDCDRNIRKRRWCSSEVCDGKDILETDIKCLCTTFEDSETQIVSNSKCILQIGGTRENKKVNDLIIFKYENEHLSPGHDVMIKSNLRLRRGFKLMLMVCVHHYTINIFNTNNKEMYLAPSFVWRNCFRVRLQ